MRGRGYIFDTSAGTKPSSEALNRSEQIDFVKVTIEDHEETGELSSTVVSQSPQAIETPRWRMNVRNVAVAAGLLIVTAIAVVVGYRFFITRAPGAAPIHSIAVLPFQNESGNPDLEYLSDGVSESLINRLSQLPGIKVIARTSSFKYKPSDDPQQVARSLGVQAILTGRVTQRGENLLISAELVNAGDKTQVWGARYDRKSSDLLAVQADISHEIAETLRLRLTAGEQQQLARRETVNPQAYELLLRGRAIRAKGGGKRAADYFNQAIAADPGYAVAYADLAMTYSSSVTASELDPKEFMPKAEAAAHRALELDESLAEGHVALAGTKLIAWDWAADEREYKRALELNPNRAGSRVMYSLYLSLMGRFDEAIAEVKRARELDPLSPAVNQQFGNRLLVARRYDEAIEAAKRSIELDETRPGGYVLLGDIYATKGQFHEAVAAFEEGVKLGAGSPDTQIYMGAAYAKAGEREKAQAILKQLETRKEYVSAALAVLYLALGEREKALARLERGYAEHDNQLQFLRSDPNFDPLRGDPRFQELMRRVGL